MKLPIGPFSLLFFVLFAGNLAAQSFYSERVSRDNILSIGFGPSFAYLDNGGQYKNLDFKINPSISLSLAKKLSPTFDLRTTVGYQYISSGGNPDTKARDRWYANYSSFTAKGPVYYFDLIPSINLLRFDNHMYRSMFNVYGGLGLGLLHSKTEQTKSFSSEEVPTKHQITTGYVPVRAGVSYRLGPYSDIAGEGTILWTFTDNLDGNEGFNKFGDHLFQAQIVFRRYFVMKDSD